MQLIFQFGTFHAMSEAELISRFPQFAGGKTIQGRFFVVETNESPAWLMQTLGGVVKILEVISSSNAPDLEFLATEIIDSCQSRNKISFGVSVINAPEFAKIGLELKRYIQEKASRPTRFVVSKTPELSSASIKLEGLLPPDGCELVVLKDSSMVIIAKTVQIQSFAEWSFRDYERPGRDAKRGMLPPKLAKMMINIATKTRDITQLHIYDPFCGSGTVLAEAALLGARRITGSDIAKFAVDDTKKGLAWAQKQFDLTAEITIFQHDATSTPRHVKPGSVDLIVAETFLGRPLKTGEQLTSTEKQDLTSLYHKALTALTPVLAPNGVIVLAIPFQTKPFELLPLAEIIADTAFSIDPILPEHETVLYMREDQRTGRQIVRLVKN